MCAIHKRATPSESASEEVELDVGFHCLWSHAAEERDVWPDTEVLAFVLGVDVPDGLSPEIRETGEEFRRFLAKELHYLCGEYSELVVFDFATSVVKEALTSIGSLAGKTVYCPRHSLG